MYGFHSFIIQYMISIPMRINLKNYLHILKLPFFYFKIKVLAVVHGVMFFTELIFLFLNIYLMTFAIHKMHIFVLGTFLCNNEKERKRYKLSERTVSLWLVYIYLRYLHTFHKNTFKVHFLIFSVNVI